MSVRLKCKECGRRYYTAKMMKQIKEEDRVCDECGGELEICKGDSWGDEDSEKVVEEKRAEEQG